MMTRTTSSGVILAIVLSIAGSRAQGQNMNQKRLQQQQQQQIQRMLQQSLGPAGGLVPNPMAKRPTDQMLYGQGSQLTEALEAAKQQTEARLRSVGVIPVQALVQALPPIIGDCPQVNLETKGPGDDKANAEKGRLEPARVIATYQNAAGQTVVVNLIDMGPLDAVAPKQEDEAPEESVQNIESGDLIMRTQKIQDLPAKIFYNRFKEAGNLTVKANRVMVSIEGTNIPFPMLEISASTVKLDDLVKLTGSKP